MKKSLLLLLVSLFFVQSYGQGSYELTLAKDEITLAKRKFYIASVVDNRLDRSCIGNIRQGIFDSNHPILLKGGLTNTLQSYFDTALPKENEQLPISIHVKTLKVSQWKTNNIERGSIDLVLEYFYNNDFLFSSKKQIVVTDDDVMQRHEGTIREALKLSLIEFNTCDLLAKLDNSSIKNVPVTTGVVTPATESNAGYIDFKPSTMPVVPSYGENRNLTTVGYQIAGYSLIGLDYEIRLHDTFGIHAGGGFTGYTYGLMFHTNPSKNSPFFNLSFKDGGFGMLQVAGIEYGGHLVLNRQSGFSLTFQIGLAKILKIKEEMKEFLFDDESPEFMASMGIGFSW